MTDDPRYSKADLDRIGRRWLDRIEAAEKRENKWIESATKAEAAYLVDEEAEDADIPAFNILHSNVETIVPSIYNSSPAPNIRPRHNNNDPAAKLVSDILERAIATQVDDNRLDSEIEGSAQDAFMAGRGIVRVKFDADDVPAETAVIQGIDPETLEQIQQEVEIAPARLTNERVIYETVSWRDYREGPAKRWSQVPWVAYRHEITEAERQRLEDDDIAEVYAKEAPDAPVDEDKDCTVWEIWCKQTGQVYFIVDVSGKVVSVTDDPLGLTGFFPQTKPVQPITGTGKRTPVCPYTVYATLAGELDTATKRINAIMKGLKVRGVIAGDMQVIEALSTLGDNELTPVPNMENLVAAGGLDKAVMWWPIETSIAVLRELYGQREQTKQAIYEITGISDIIRGQGNSQETATAQNIKTQWGALRIKKMQRLIERQVRDLFVISAELISLKFSYETLQKITGIQVDQNAAPLLQSAMDHYRIDVESDSTVRADLTRQREEMARFLEGTAQFFATMQPVVASAPQSAAPLTKMYAAFARQFTLGKSAEDAIEEFTQMAEQAAQQPQGPSAQEQAMQAEMQMKMQEFQGKMQLEVEKLKLQAANLQLDGQVKQVELAIKKQEAGIKADQVELAEAKAEVDAISRAAEFEMEQEQQRAVKIGSD